MKLNFNGSLPIQASEVARDWDTLYWVMTGVSLFFFVLVVGLMVYSAIAHRERPGHQASYFYHNSVLEFVWTAVPTVLLMGIFAWGWKVYHDMVSVPGDAYEIRVLGKQWLWNFIYEDGRVTTNELYVPAGRPIKLLMTSQDVLHSFFIPDFRIKQDVVPGMYTHVWFNPENPGEHVVFCAEYCGTSHSGMIAKVIALNEKDWQAWWRGKQLASIPSNTTGKSGETHAAGSLINQGQKLTQTKGCVACHSIDGSRIVGPSYKSLYGSRVEFSDGSTAQADENYIRESITNPQGKKVKGYEALVMPPYPGDAKEEEITAIIAYIKSLK